MRKTVPGARFNRLTVLSRTDIYKKSGRMFLWLYQCDCGKEVTLPPTNVLNGHTKSCGCLNSELAGNRFRKHSMCGTPTWQYWINMRDRCHNPKHDKFKYYGGRGIFVCDAWRHDSQSFFDEIGKKPSPAHTIDRIDNDRGYEPGNVKWSARETQIANRRNTVRVIWDGDTVALADLCRRMSMPYRLVSGRLRAAWPLAKAIQTPIIDSQPGEPAKADSGIELVPS